MGLLLATVKKTAPTSVFAAGHKVKILGVHRIWETLKSTRTSAVNATLKKLATNCDQLFEKRKTMAKNGGREGLY